MSSQPAIQPTRDIVIEELFPHAPGAIWRTLTSGELIGRWLMAPSGFEPVTGTEFTFQTTPAGAWDGTIRCRVLEVVPERRIAYSWRGGHADNVGYGSLLDTVVSWTLTPEGDGTRLRLIHAGFELPRNETALTNMSAGWRKIVGRVGDMSAEDRAATAG